MKLALPSGSNKSYCSVDAYMSMPLVTFFSHYLTMPLKHSLHFYGQFLIPWKQFFQTWKGLLSHYQSHIICFANNLDLIKISSKTMLCASRQ